MSAFQTVQTSIKPKSFGKVERKQKLAMKLTLQLFKSNNTLDRIIAHMSSTGSISFYLLRNMNLSNSVTTKQNLEMRPVLISVPLDVRSYTTAANRTNYSNSSKEMTKLLFHPQSPYNSAIVKGSLNEHYIPHYINNKDNPELNWNNEKHNVHAKELATVLSKIADLNLTDADKDAAYTKAWTAYEQAEQNLINKGVLVSNQVVVVDQDGLIPIVSINQYSSSSNKFFDSKAIFGHENSQATYAPLLNKVSGVVSISDTALDSNTDWVYGISNLGESNLKATSKEVLGFNLYNEPMENPMRIIVTDTYGNKGVKEGDTRSERFLDFCENQAFAEVSDAELQLGFSRGGLTSIFTLTGDEITYKSHTPVGSLDQPSIKAIDFDQPVDFEMDDLVSLDTF